MSSIKLNETTISYQDQGQGDVVVLLHGFCGNSHYWDNIIPPLAAKFRIIAPDLPGHGDSSVLSQEYTIEDMADMLKSLLDELKIGQATMFGHSLGGYITLAFAERYAERLKGFSLVHSTAFPDSEEAKTGRMVNAEKVKKEGISSLINGLIPKLFSPDNFERNQSDIEIAKQIGYKTSPQGAISTLIAMKNRPDRNYVLEQTKLPVLLIAGEKDQVISVEKTFSVSKDHIQQKVIIHSGHMSMYENPEELINEIKTFLITSKG